MCLNSPLDETKKTDSWTPGYVLLFTANFLTVLVSAVCCSPHPPPRGVATPLARRRGKSTNESTVARQLVPCEEAAGGSHSCSIEKQRHNSRGAHHVFTHSHEKWKLRLVVSSLFSLDRNSMTMPSFFQLLLLSLPFLMQDFERGGKVHTKNPVFRVDH